VLCSRLVRNHPPPDGNKRVAYLCMSELIRRNGCEWRPTATADERAAMVDRLAGA
jgi:death on curing protein